MSKKTLTKVTFLLIVVMGSGTDLALGLEGSVCEPIKVDMCRQIGYNKTAMPNLAGHSLQADAKYELETFAPLIQSGCANELQFFLCFAYVPMCVVEATTPQMLIGPCRPLCERVRSSCLSLLEQFKYTWPPVLNCSKFPESNNHDHMCIEGPGASHVPLRLPPTSLHTLQTNPLFMQKVKEQLAEGSKSKLLEKYNYKSYVQLLESNFDKQRPAQGINVQCGRFKKSSQYHYLQRLDKCIPICQADIIFTKDDKHTSNMVIIALSAACLCLSLVTLSTLAIDGAFEGRTFPDLVRKSSLFLTLAATGLCSAFIISRFFKPEDLCLKSDEQEQPMMLAAQEGHRSRPCTVIFLLLNFFSGSVSNWFSAMMVTWIIASASRTSHFISLQTLSTLTHVYGWGIPAVLTITAIVAHQVEADELSSLCLPGGFQNDSSLLIFTVLPQGVQFVVGVFASFVAVVFAVVKMNDTTSSTLTSTSVVVRKKPKDLQLRNLTMNYVIFSLSYILSAGCVWGINVYEYFYRSLWLDASQPFVPEISPFLFRLIMTFMMAMSPVAVIITRESGVAWKKFLLERFLGGLWNKDKQRTPVYPQVAYQPQATVENQVHIGHDYYGGQNL